MRNDLWTLSLWLHTSTGWSVLVGFLKKYLSICLLTVSDFRSCIGVNYRLKKFRISLKTYPGLLFGTKHVYNSLGKEKYNWPLNNVGLRNTDPPGSQKSKYHLCACMLVTELCLTFCNNLDCSPTGSSIHGIIQSGILE